MSKTPNINQILRKAQRPCILYGAPLGSKSFCDTQSRTRIYIQRLRFTDGCYAADGTYWGMPATVWCAFDWSEETGSATRIFVRAKDRTEATENACKEFPSIRARIFRA